MSRAEVILVDSESERDSDTFDTSSAGDDGEVQVVKVVPAPRNLFLLREHHAISVYVDGSYRPHANPARMAGGVYVVHNALSIARILVGGPPDSCRAELGSIYAALQFVSLHGLSGLAGKAGRAAQREVAAGARDCPWVELRIHTDCQSSLDMLQRRDRIVRSKYIGLVHAIRHLILQMPCKVRLIKVQGHSKKSDIHAMGNWRAHNLAYKCDMHHPVCLLPA